MGEAQMVPRKTAESSVTPARLRGHEEERRVE